MVLTQHGDQCCRKFFRGAREGDEEMNKTIQTFALVLIASTALAACGKKKIDDIPPAADGTGYGNDGQGQGSGMGGIMPGSQDDFIQSVGMNGDRVFFDTDRFNIDAADQATLQSQAQWLARYPNARIVIEGHCDERGTRDYNLALGERRANAAKNYLASLGVDASRIQTVSYGKERPAAAGSNEQAWALNRRAVTVTIQ
jgi:peptidoglycan-associated lipoprotein